MLPDLATVFEKKCSEHVSLKLLAAQWDFDQILLTKALQNIQINFPHYSRHDASHSRQILTNIERMLGDKIEFFTATDLWLLLEAAYSHDLGMVITQKQISDLDTDEFKDYVKELTEDSENELHDFATNWLTEKAQLPQGSKSYKFLNKYKQLIAEWYRRYHSQNSSKYVKDPVIEIGLNSPRNELLPKRLFNILGDICASHGLPFTDVMKLPYTEAGLGIDDCHPRFIACLLRMGDLLDVDDNRFCPVMMNVCGEGLPDSSILHFEKHQSIKHLRIDSERIKIEVECITPEVYEVTYDWFRWVETEYHHQLQNWPKICPVKEFGKLPSLSTPIVTVKKPYIILEEGEKPSFKVNSNKVLGMLRSTGLYNDKLDFIREVLQNSVDATLVAIWHDHKIKIIDSEPYGDDFYKIANEYKINISVEQVENSIKICIRDNGIGISKCDLNRILNVGSSKSKTDKSKLISEMPTWLRPSGNFGIGLQSLFLVTDKFKITTKSRISHDCYEIFFFKDKNKGVSIKEGVSKNINYGSEVEFYINNAKFPDSIKIKHIYHDDKYIIDFFDDYDLTNSSSDLSFYEIIKILDGVDEFNFSSPIKIYNSKECLHEYKNERKGFFSKENNVYLKCISFANSLSGGINHNTFFKGQRFEGINKVIPIIYGAVDFYGYDAVDFLSFDRSKILKSSISNSANDIVKSVLDYIDSNFETFNCEEKSLAGAFCCLYADEPLKNKYCSYIDELKVNHNLDAITFKELCSRISNGEISHTFVYMTRIDSIPEYNNSVDYMEVTDLVQELLKLIVTKGSFFWSTAKFDPHELEDHAVWSNKENIPIDKSKGIKNLLKNDENRFIGNRVLFPCWGKYHQLKINVTAPWAKLIEHERYEKAYMILPMKFSFGGKISKDTSSEIIEWIYNSLIKKIERDEIKKLIESLYEDVIEFYSLEGNVIN